MSKLFEALQRLERDTGRPLDGVSSEARQILLGGTSAGLAAIEGAVTAVGEQRVELSRMSPASTALVTVDPYALEHAPVDHATITPASRLVYYLHPSSQGAERFRQLRAGLQPAWDAGKLKTVLVTSARTREGKSTIALNLATALAEGGHRRVLLLEANLLDPGIGEAVGLPNRPGLAECIESDRNPLGLLHRIEPLGWYFLSAGQSDRDSDELLQSPRLATIFSTLRSRFDWIIVDAPPIDSQNGTLSLKRFADGALLAIRSGRTTQDAVEEAVSRIGKQQLLGVVLNGSRGQGRPSLSLS